LLPDQAPVPVQDVALVDDQVIVELPPLGTELGLTLRLTVGVDDVTETMADCEALPPEPVQVKVYVELLDRAPVDCEPVIGLVPVQSPDAVQEVAFVADQLKVEPDPVFTVLGLALKVTFGADAAAATVTDCEVLPPVPVQVSV
jgi:hypothetical protein